MGYNFLKNTKKINFKILFVIASLLFSLLVVATFHFFNSSHPTELAKIEYSFSEDGMKKLLSDPMYRPLGVLQSYANYKKDSRIDRIDIKDLSLGKISTESNLSGGVGDDYLILNGRPIFGIGEFITLAQAFRKSSIDLLFFVTQSPGTCCGRFKSIYVLRSINGIGYGIENIGVLYTGADTEETLRSRFKVAGEKILIDLDIHKLEKKFVSISPEGGVVESSRPIQRAPVSKEYCDFLWTNVVNYFESHSKSKAKDENFQDFLDRSNYQRQMYDSIINTQSGFNEKNYFKIASRATHEESIHPNLRSLFEKEVCGSYLRN